MTSQDKQPGAQASGQVSIDPRVALIETTAEAEAEIAFHKSWNRNRRMLLAQEAHVLRQTVEAQKAEIERLTAATPADAKKEA
jgi:hypothetical protein